MLICQWIVSCVPTSPVLHAKKPAWCLHSGAQNTIFSNLVETKISLDVERFCVGAFNCQLGFIYSAVYCSEQIKKHFAP